MKINPNARYGVERSVTDNIITLGFFNFRFTFSYCFFIVYGRADRACKPHRVPGGFGQAHGAQSRNRRGKDTADGGVYV